MSNNSIIEHRANYYYVEFREEFLIICMNLPYKKTGKDGKKSAASPHCEALILAIIENWTNNKRGRNEDLAIFMTYRQWADSMYNMFGRTVIIDSLDELQGNKLLSREHYKMMGNKDTYKYKLEYKKLNELVRALPERDLYDTRPKMNGSTETKPNDPSRNERVTHPEMNAYPSKNGHSIATVPQLHNTTSEGTSLEQDSAKGNASHTPALTLLEKMTEIERAFWKLWCNMSFNVIAPKLTETAYNHIKELAPHITTKEQLKSLVEYSRQKLIKAGKDGTVHLGNLRNDLNEWKQKQVEQVAPVSQPTSDTPTFDINQTFSNGLSYFGSKKNPLPSRRI